MSLNRSARNGRAKAKTQGQDIGPQAPDQPDAYPGKTSAFADFTAAFSGPAPSEAVWRDPIPKPGTHVLT